MGAGAMKVGLISAALAVMTSVLIGCGGLDEGVGGKAGTSTSRASVASGGGAGGAGGGAPVEALDLSANKVTMTEAEQSIVATADGRLAIAWIGVSAAGTSVIGTSFSKDAGATWSAPIAAPQPANLLAS